MSQEPFEAATLDDLGEVPFTIMLDRPDGRKVKVKLHALSESELFEIRHGVVYPTPPVKDIKKIEGEVLEVFDYLNKDFVKATQDADRVLSRRVLAAMLVMDIPGDTLDAKAEQVKKKLGNWAFEYLVGVARRVNSITEGQVNAVMASFRAESDSSISGDAGARPDTPAMAELVEG